MNNYICVNGKKAPLTDEQLKLLGVKKEYKNLWIKSCEYRSSFAQETKPKYKIECPECHSYFYIYIEPHDSLFRAHTYCGYCGHKNMEEIE